MWFVWEMLLRTGGQIGVSQTSSPKLSPLSRAQTKGPIDMFSPLAFAAGMIVYDLTISLPPASHLALSPFELYREPLVIVAIADGSELAEIAPRKDGQRQSIGSDYQAHLRQLRELDQELESLRDRYPKALVHQLLLFDYNDANTASKLPQGLVPVPPQSESNITTMKTVMCDLSALLLAEMTTMAKSFQGMTMIESPNKARSAGQIGYSWENADRELLSGQNSQYSTPVDSRTGSPQGGKSDRSQVRMSMPAAFRPSPAEHIRSASTSRPGTPNTGYSTPTDERTPAKSPEHPSLSRANSMADRLRDNSRDRISIQGFGSGSLSERSRNKGKGRVSIAIGALYLQAGRWNDAIKELVDGAYIAKTNNDHLWHGKALENILVSMLMLAWAGLDFQIPNICYSSSEKAPYHTPPAAVLDQPSPTTSRLASLQNLTVLFPELLEKILGLYERASNFQGEALPQLPFSEAVIRFSKLLATVHLAGGKLDDNALELLVLGKSWSKTPNISIPRVNVHPLRTTIITTLFRAFPSSAAVAELPVIDRTIILSGIASVLGNMGYERKKAMVMRELISVLIPGLVQARMVGAAEMGIHPAAGLAALSSINSHTNGNGAGALDLSEGDVESGVDDLLSLMGRIYGVVSFRLADKRSNSKAEKELDDSDEGVIKRIMENAASRQFGDKALKMNVLRASINLSEALPDFKGVLRFTSDLLRTAGTGVAPGPRSEDAKPVMSREEQVRLATNISRTVDAATKMGLKGLVAEYWDEFLVRGVELEPLPGPRTPIPHKSTELGRANSTTNTAQRNPFIYNPFLRRPDAAAVDRLLVSGESAIFKVTLQNPYEFDIVIESIRLQADGGNFESAVQDTVVGPYRTQILNVLGTPTSAGNLTINGCLVKVRGCRERRFPIFLESWSPPSELKIKAFGLGAAQSREKRPLSTASGLKKPAVNPALPKPSFLKLTVIEKQPIVVIKSTTLSQSAAMVLEGERQIFSVTLKNLSINTPADLLLFSFQDSTQGQLQAALSNRDASPAELYEYELVLLKKQALRWIKRSDEPLFIEPGATITVDFEILGKPGLTSATVQVDYAYLGMPTSEVNGTFHTRQVSLPLTITVNASIELSRIDVLPLGGYIAPHLWPSGPNSVSQASGEGFNPKDYTLLSLDLRNAWPSPLRIELSMTPDLTFTEDILPGLTTRLIVPIKRIWLDDPYAAVPTLDPSRQRQFVVSSSRITAEGERAVREGFWFREEILKNLKGRWSTINGLRRNGTVELRGMRLGARMIETLRVEGLGIELHIDSSTTSSSKTKVVLVDNSFRLVVKLSNRTSSPISPLLRLQPSLRNHSHNAALDLSKKIVWEGTLQRVLQVLEAGGEREVSIGITPLCQGDFEIGASVEEVRLTDQKKMISGESGNQNGKEEAPRGRQRANTGALMDALLGGRERRIWNAREPCVFTVVDGDDSSDESDDE
jgi:hypothetical protein